MIDPRNGTWSCVLTLGSKEGAGAQRVVSTVSYDRGNTWSELVDVEPYTAPPGLQPRSTGWINNLIVPSNGRQYAFYTFNFENVTTSPLDGTQLANSNLLGRSARTSCSPELMVVLSQLGVSNVGESGALVELREVQPDRHLSESSD